MKTETFHWNDLSIAYDFQAGPRQNSPLLTYLNGLTQTLIVWRLQTGAFSNNYHQLTFDFPGQALSSRLHRSLSLADQTGLFADLLTHVAQKYEIPTLAPRYFIGFSYGSRILYEYLAQMAVFADSPLMTAVFVGSGFNPSKEQAERYETWLTALRLQSEESEVEALTRFFWFVQPQIFGERYLQVNATMHQGMLKSFLMRTDYRSLLYLIEALRDYATSDANPHGPPLPYHTCIVRGADDALCLTSNCAALGQRFIHSESHEIPGCGHAVAIEQPAAFTACAQEFFGKINLLLRENTAKSWC